MSPHSFILPNTERLLVIPSLTRPKFVRQFQESRDSELAQGMNSTKSSNKYSSDYSENVHATAYIGSEAAYELDEVYNDSNAEEDAYRNARRSGGTGQAAGSTKEEVHPDDFPSYSELKNYTVARLLESGLTESLCNSNPDDYLFFRALLQRHPRAEEKKTAQIIDIRIRLFPDSVRGERRLEVKDYQMHIITADGGEDTISWVSCVRQETLTDEHWTSASESKASDKGNITLTCKDCRAPFTFSKKEQELFASKQFPPPVRCKDCIGKKRNQSNRPR